MSNDKIVTEAIGEPDAYGVQRRRAVEFSFAGSRFDGDTVLGNSDTIKVTMNAPLISKEQSELIRLSYERRFKEMFLSRVDGAKIYISEDLEPPAKTMPPPAPKKNRFQLLEL